MLETVVRKAESLLEKTQRKMDEAIGQLCVMLFECTRLENICVFEQQVVDTDEQKLHDEMSNRIADEMEICRIFVQSSDERLKALATTF